MSFDDLRNKYEKIIYEKYDIDKYDNYYLITYYFNIPSLTVFTPTIKIPVSNKEVDNDTLDYLVFHVGLIELISYYKCVCPKLVEIKAGYIDEEQISWFKKLYYYGLGEFMYVNHIECSLDDLMDIICTSDKKYTKTINYNGIGNMLAIGGGKDSIVSLNILKDLDNICFMINPKTPGIEAIKEAGFDDYIAIERTIDKKLLELNKEGYLNGHTPFSSLVAFLSYLTCYLNNRKYIILSNESSANEPTVIGTKINHQYSKTYEFEQDFNNYTNKYFRLDIKYFSLLRCLSEFQIGMLFSSYKNYHKIFKSCNVGSKQTPWIWCCNCPKCLFVYIILSPFLHREELVNIFGLDLYEKEELLDTFTQLCGYSTTKPFECVGTYSEVRYAVSLCIKNNDNLPFLLRYYKEHYPLELDHDYIHEFNDKHNIPLEFEKIVKEELTRVVGEIDAR